MHRLAGCLVFYFCVLSVGQTQCLKDRHNTSFSSHWISCQTSENPVTDRGMSHWIMYELDDVYTIEGIHVWNVNHPNGLGYDVRELAVDYSDNGVDWNHLGTYTLPIANGSAFYTGEQLTDIENFTGRFVVLTALSNYGANCSGLGEVRFDLTDVTTAVSDIGNDIQLQSYPNPFSRSMKVVLRSIDPGTVRWWVRDALGRIMKQGEERAGSDICVFEVDGLSLSSGHYYLTVITKESVLTEKLAVVHPQN